MATPRQTTVPKDRLSSVSEYKSSGSIKSNYAYKLYCASILQSGQEQDS